MSNWLSFGKLKQSIGTLINSYLSESWSFSSYQLQMLSFIVFPIILMACSAMYVIYRWRKRNENQVGSGITDVGSKARFRKRDKMIFYGRKMLRKVKNISGQVRGTQGKKRKLVMKLAHQLLRMKKDSYPPKLKVMEPPEEFLQEDSSGTEEPKIPSDVFSVLRGIRTFGHFEKPIFLKLCKRMEIVNLPAGAYVFKIGDPDENVYIVQTGKVHVFVTNQSDVVIPLKTVRAGDSLTSLLSFTDVLTGHPQPFKTVCAKAMEDTTIVKLPVSAFQQIFEEHPGSFIRVIQVIMIRLQRVTFTALPQYLGLTTELVNPGSCKRKNGPYATSSANNNQTTTQPASQSSSFHEVMNDNVDVQSQSQADIFNLPNLLPNVFYRGHRRSRSGVDVKIQSDLTSDINSQQHSAGYHGKKKSVIEFDPTEVELKNVTDIFIKNLGLEDDALLSGKIEIREVPSGIYLMKEESHKDAALVYLISGTLSIFQKALEENDEPEKEVFLYTVYPGEIVGGLPILTGEQSVFNIKTKHFSRIAVISKTTFLEILTEKPQVVLHVAHMVIQRLSPFVRQVDFALDWLFLESGRAVYRQDDDSDSTYIVLSGRLRSVITHPDGKKELVGEYGKGDLVGIVEMVTQNRRSTTVMAVRDSELAKLPEGLFNAMKLRYPIVVTRLIKLLGHRILGAWKKPNLKGTLEMEKNLPHLGNYSTVAVVPSSDDVPLTAFTHELFHSATGIGPTLRLTSEEIKKMLGSSIMDHGNEYRLTGWLAQQEDNYRLIIYQCDYNYSLWTQRCVRQADCVLIVALGDKTPVVGKIEKEIEKFTVRTQKELVLLHHGSRTDLPSNTVAWLNMRNWISSHHHIKCPRRLFASKSQSKIDETYSKVITTKPDIHSDFSRLARWLTGTSVGLVLGGGGARGSAHVGMIKAIQEVGIPIDMVGGVSIGAFMGGLWCMERDIIKVTQKAREWSMKMTCYWRQLFDLTYPITAMFTGKHFNGTIKHIFDDIQIEDLWIPYFTVTTDISASGMRVHTHGSLWRYCRASMSLSGYMPPICDPNDGHLLLDGGYVNNLPADVMRRHGAQHILAIDVGSQDDTDHTNYGDSLSGWWVFWKRYNPFTTAVKVPSLPDIQSRLAYVSCVRQLEEVKNSEYYDYIRPPIDKYKSLQFNSFDEIREVGYGHGKIYFNAILKSGNLPAYLKLQDVNFVGGRRTSTKPKSPSTYTFTDLAEMVCKIQPSSLLEESSSDSEYEPDEEYPEIGYASEPASVAFPGNANMMKRVSGTRSLSENELESETEYVMSQDETPKN